MVITDFLLGSGTAVFAIYIVALCLYLYFRKKRNQKNAALAVDDLTGLPKKQQYNRQVTEILQTQKGKYAYVSCDIIDFKCFNEKYGYESGNEVLRYIASTWKADLQKNEAITRISEDQFSMFLSYETQEKLELRLKELLLKTSEELRSNRNENQRVLFQCGIYLIESSTQSPAVMRARAEMARLQVKPTHNTTISFFDKECVRKRLQEKELENDIESALSGKELLVYFQPKFDVLSEHVIGAEALVRWNHPKRGMLHPEVFIPLCETNGFICEIDFYVLEEVCRRMKQWKENGTKLIKVSVNFSRMHLAHEDFVDRLTYILNKYEVDPSYVEVELTESIAYGEVYNLVQVMKKVKEAGFGLSMDDFGSGYSSLNLLREMPLDVLKLDKDFFGQYEDDSGREQKILHHIISMAKDLDIAVLAEGVETERQKEFLKKSRCDIIQGYYYAKPMPVDTFTTYINQISA